MDFTAITYLGSSIIALFIGFLTGIFGVGGGFLMAPSLIILLGIPPNIAVGADLVVIFINSSFGMYKRRGTGTVDVKLGVTLAGGSIFGVLIGVQIMESLKSLAPVTILGKEQSPLQYFILWLFLLLLVCIIVLLLFDLYRSGGRAPEKRVGLFAKIKIPPYAHFGSLEEPRLAIIPIVLLGCAAGILTGLLGVGGGVIIMPALIYLIGQRSVKAAGTSLLLVWISSMVASTGHIAHGNIKPLLLAGMLIGGIIGTNFGTHIGLKLTGPKIRFYFVYVVIAATILVAFKLYVMTFA
ncbi:MAG: sulfite exporter TauE/SafE family protein [Planctomycetota bacterium]|jgi:uncharacterized membrane protein YfcA